MNNPFEDYVVFAQYEPITVAGIMGKIKNPLQTVRDILKRTYPTANFSQIINGGPLDILEGIVPTDNLEFMVGNDNKSTGLVIVKSLNWTSSLRNLKDLSNSINLTPTNDQRTEFERLVHKDAQQNLIVYIKSAQVAQRFNMSPEQMFGLTTYSNFLMRTSNISNEEALYLACKKLGLEIGIVPKPLN